MIVNGKYIEYSDTASASIQTQINKNDFLKGDLKSEVKNPRDAIKDYEPGMDFNNFSFFNVETTSFSERKNRYDYYKEMDTMEFIHRALEIVADDSTQANSEGAAIKIYSDDEGIKDIISDLLLERLDMNNELWNVIYDTAKMGDGFWEIVPDDYENPKKIVYLKYIQPDRIERIEKDGKLSHYEYSPDTRERSNGRGFVDNQMKPGEKTVYKLQPWQVVHFKVQTDRESDPYGGSLLKSGIRTYRRLSILEDVILVYRISRAPERRVFNIDVGNLNYTDAKKFVQKIKEQYRTQNFIDENGNLNKKANVLSITSDIFVPIREGGVGTKIDTLQGGEALKTIDDLDYFKDKILRVMNIPMAYLGDDADRSRGSLSQQDIKFARFIERIQAQIVKGLNKIVATELFFNGQKKDALVDFRLELTAPSNIKELTEIDLINQRMGLVGLIQGLNIYSTDWILKHIMHHSDREISEIKMQKAMETQAASQQNPDMGAGALPPEGGMPADLGAAAAPGGDGIETGAAGGTEAPEVGGAPGVPTPEAGTEQLTASTIINLFGKEFITENKEDFFKIVKASKMYIKEQTNEPNVPILLEQISDIVNLPVSIKQKNRTPALKRQFALNEMGGLIFPSQGKGRAIKLYERKSLKENVKIKEEIFYLND